MPQRRQGVGGLGAEQARTDDADPGGAAGLGADLGQDSPDAFGVVVGAEGGDAVAELGRAGVLFAPRQRTRPRASGDEDGVAGQVVAVLEDDGAAFGVQSFGTTREQRGAGIVG